MRLSAEDYKELLTLFTDLQVSNENQKKSGVHDYSLMNALLKKTDEVHLHSNFIYSMIDPKGNHYCGNIFLEIFLESLGERDFINLDQARVHKEKGKIDILIEDGINILIIENKLRAIDQVYQISRYIHYVIDNYMEEFSTIDDKIHVVYLSEYKKIPDRASESIIGFEEIDNKSTKLVWKGVRTVLCKDHTCNFLKKGTKLDFRRVQHSRELMDWVNQSKDWLVLNRPSDSSLMYAFNEYELILKRLDTRKRWSNIVSLDEYVLELSNEEDQKKMSDLMEQSYKKLNDFKGKKLFQNISKLFENYPKTKCFINGKEFKEFTMPNSVNWFKKSGTKENYQDVGLEVEIKNEKYIFAMGVKNIAFGRSSDFEFSKNIVSNREKDIFEIISEIEIKLKKF